MVQSVAAIERLTLTGGSFGSGILGGGIVNNDAVLTVSDSIVSGNDGGCQRFFNGKICAAGIVQFGGTTTLRRSAVTNNRLGIRVDSGGVLRVENSTISANTEFVWHFCSIGCGCSAEPAFYAPDAVVDVAHSTIADNLVDPSPPCVTTLHRAAVLGDAVFEASVISNPGMTNCLLAGSVQSTGHNIDSDGSCGLTDPSDLSNVDPLLRPLQGNGGPTPTHALLRGSPAIDRIPTAACTYEHDGDPGTPEVALSKDQRGGARPREGDGAPPNGCDVGAYEVAACADGLDNDGLIDFDGGATAGITPLASPDPSCGSALGNNEAPPPPPGCGLGPELAPALVLLGIARRRSRSPL